MRIVNIFQIAYLIKRAFKTRRRNQRVYFYLDIFAVFFFLIEMLLIRIFSVFIEAWKLMNNGVGNASISELQESKTDIAFHFFISVLIVIIFILLVGTFILASSYFSMTIKQFFVLFQEKIKTKLLLGISIPYIVCEFIAEVFFYFLFTVMMANIIGLEIIKELVEMFPVKEYFVNNSLFAYAHIQFFLFFGAMMAFSYNYFLLKKMVTRLDESIR